MIESFKSKCPVLYAEFKGEDVAVSYVNLDRTGLRQDMISHMLTIEANTYIYEHNIPKYNLVLLWDPAYEEIYDYGWVGGMDS